jgi:hypothetical protein
MMPVFDFIEGSTPLLISMPHCGTAIPAEYARGMTDVAQQVADTDGTDAIAVKDGRIAWLGAMEELPTDYESQAVVDGEGRWLTPVRFARGRGLIYWFWIPDIPASTARPVRLCWTAGFSQPTATR